MAMNVAPFFIHSQGERFIVNRKSKFLTQAVWIGVLLLAVSGSAFAQLQSGNVYGVVSDTEGGLLPGVAVTLSGGGAPQIQVTDEIGQFRFLGLDPGTYRIEAALDGFSTVVYETVTVAVGRNTTIEMAMQAAIEDVITVTSESPLLDSRKITSGATLNQTELEKIPTSRDPWSVLQSVPGVKVDRINVGGSESGQQSNYTGPGSDDDDGIWAVDGVVITDMAAIGSSPSYYNFDAFSEMQISTGGSDASAATGGVVMNMVTKRGTNEWRAGGRYIVGDGDWQSSTGFSNSDLGDGSVNGNVQEPFEQLNEIVNVRDWGADVGGPIWKDKLWIWANYGEQNIELLTAGGSPDDTDLETYGAKLNWQVVTANSATVFYNYGDKLKFGRGASPTRTAPTTWNQTGPTDIIKIEDTHIFGSSFFVTGMWSDVGGGFELDPQGGDPGPAIYWDEDFVWQNNFFHHTSDRPQEQYKLDGNYFFNTGELGHELKFGAGYREAVVTASSSMPSQQIVWAWFPIVNIASDTWAEQYTEYTSAYLQDTMTFGDLTINAGLRYDSQDGGVSDAFTAAVPGFEQFIPDNTVEGAPQDFTWEDISPRLGLTYALGEDRSTLLRASYARFAEQLRNSYSGQHSAAGAYRYAYFYYDDLNGDQTITPDEILNFDDGPVFTNGYEQNPGSTLNQTSAGFTAPLTDELILGVEHSLLPELVVGANVTYRNRSKMVDRVRLVNDGSGTDYGYGAPGYRLEQRGDFEATNVQMTLPDGTQETIQVWGFRDGIDDSGNYDVLTNADFEQNFLGGSLTFNKRLSNQWMLRGNISFSDWEWDVPAGSIADPNVYQQGVEQPDIGQIDGGPVLVQSGGSGKAEIYLSSGWSYSLTGMYQIAPERAWGFNLSGALNGREGYDIPYQWQGTAQGISGGTVNILATDAVDRFSLDDLHMLDLRVEKEVAISEFGLTFGLEVFNALNDGTVLQRRTQLNTASADHVTEVVSPRIFRATFRFSFN
jgi:hypothetical protein